MKRTVSPGQIAAGTRPGSNTSSALRPMICHPPADSRGYAYLPARDADRTSRHPRTWGLAPRGGNSGINRTQYANPGRNPSMKTRYSASACAWRHHPH